MTGERVVHPGKRLGRLPKVDDPRTLRLARYLPTLPTPPACYDASGGVTSWPMYANDRLGDCAIAGPGHAVNAWTALAGHPVVLPESAILEAYSAVSGYDPATGAHDDGCVLLDVLNHWRKTGIGGHRIGAFVSVDLRDRYQTHAALWLFNGLLLGLNLPVRAQHEGVTWTTPKKRAGDDTPGSWGGHCTWADRYDAKTIGDITWGAQGSMTYGFWSRYADEAFAIVSTDVLDTTARTPQGFDVAQLNADLAALGKPQ